MTYNFDPERWYEIERACIEARCKTGVLTAVQRECALQQLEARYAEMWARLDGSYRIPRE